MGADSLRQTLVQIRAANAGDRAALNDLLERHLPWVRGHVQRSISRELRLAGATDEVVQESLVDAFRAIARFEDRTTESFKKWLARIVLNNVRDIARQQARQRREDRLGPDAGRASEIATREPRPSEVACGRELQQRLAAAMQKLPPLHRQILELREQGLDDAGIAARLAYKNADTIRALHHRARARLRDLLAGSEPP